MERSLLIVGLVFLAACCVALVAWITLLTGHSPLWAAALAGVFALAFLLWWATARLRSRRGARGLERGLLEQGKTQAKLTRPDQRREMQQLQRDFEQAVRDLKASRLGRSGRDALYLLPWYAMIGPSGAGKTTALRNSGLRFPKLRGQENLKVRGIGGTRNCDFWLTNDAVLLDTAGRWSTQDDQPEWLSFLQLLRRHRPRKPLNGLIATIGVGDVVNASADEIDALAEHMRNRLEEVTSELRVSIPIYVLFTKCDLVEGFVEMFGALRATEREQILGFTVPLTRAHSSPETLFEEYFEELSETLRGAALTRMGQERSSRERQLLFAFPEQFWTMRRNLSRFVTRLFETNVYRETAPLRGVYFSSGTQEGRPFSLLATARGDAPQPVDHKGYFLRELFMRVIFEDSDVASASAVELRRQRRVQAALTACLVVVTLIAGVVPASAFLRSRRQLDQTARHVGAAEAKPGAGSPPLGALRQVLGDLAQFSLSPPRWLTTLGMYTGDKVLPVLERYTAHLMRRDLVQPVFARDLASMADFGLRYESLSRALPTTAEHETFYERLKLHLLLSAQQLPRAYAQWVCDRLAARFEDTALGRAAQPLAEQYTRYAQAYPELAFARDADVVVRVRAALTRTSAAQQALDTIVAHVATLGYDLDLQKMAGYNSGLVGSRRIRGAFTRRGWEKAVRELFEHGAPEHVDELWVLGLNEGTSASADRAARLDELSSLYFRAYVQEWRAFLEAVHTKAPGDADDALALLTQLTSGEPTPMARLFQAVGYNARLLALPSDPKGKDAPADGADTSKETLARVWKRDKPKVDKHGKQRANHSEPFGPAQVAAAFEAFVSFGVATDNGEVEGGSRGMAAPTPYDAYREQLTYLRDALRMRAEDPSQTQQIDSQLQTAVVRVRGLIESQPPTFRPVFEALLWPPIKGLREGAGREDAAWTGGQWCSEVVSAYERTLQGRYPFHARGRDARLDDFDAFYRPADGLLWKFTAAALADEVQLRGDDYVFTPKYEAGGPGALSRKLLEFLNRSRAISQAFYPNTGHSARIDFKVRLHGASSRVDTTVFSVGGKSVSYDNGPLSWQSLSWPGPEPAKGAGFNVRGKTLRAGNEISGVWGLFRLLEASDVQRAGDDVISVSWRVPTDDVRVWLELKPAHPNTPFFDARDRSPQPALLKPLRGSGVSVPHRIASAQPRCTP